MMDLCCRRILGIDVQDMFSMPIGDAINSAMGLEIILVQVSSRQIPLHPATSLYSESALAACLLVGAVVRYSRGCFRVCPSRMYDKLIEILYFVRRRMRIQLTRPRWQWGPDGRRVEKR